MCCIIPKENRVYLFLEMVHNKNKHSKTPASKLKFTSWLRISRNHTFSILACTAIKPWYRYNWFSNLFERRVKFLFFTIHNNLLIIPLLCIRYKYLLWVMFLNLAQLKRRTRWVTAIGLPHPLGYVALFTHYEMIIPSTTQST